MTLLIPWRGKLLVFPKRKRLKEAAENAMFGTARAAMLRGIAEELSKDWRFVGVVVFDIVVLIASFAVLSFIFLMIVL